MKRQWISAGVLAALALFFIYRQVQESRAEDALILAGALSQSKRTISEIDPHVVVTDVGQAAVSWMGISHVEGEGDAARVIGARTSADYGATWSNIQTLRSPDRRFSTDSMLAGNRGGTIALTWLGFHQNLVKGGEPYDLAVYLARATPVTAASKGLASPGDPPTFAPPHEVTAGVAALENQKWLRFDKPWTAMFDNGDIAVSYRFEIPMGAGIRVSRSHDGEHFEHAVVARGTPFGGTLATICAAREGGRAFVAYVDAGHSIWADVVVHGSTDYGATWPEDRRLVVSRTDDHAVVEAPTCITTGDSVFIAYGLGVTPPNDSSSALAEALVVVQSLDGGRTFPRRFEYREPNALMAHLTLARLPSGEFDLMMLAGKEDGDAHGAIRRVRLGKDGTPRGPSEILKADVRVVMRRAPEKGWTGDFMGLAVNGDHELAAMGENTSGAPQLLFRSLETR